MKGINIKEASRAPSGDDDGPIRVKFFSLKERNIVLQAGRQIRGIVKIGEVFTENVKNARNHLADFARQESKETR